MALTTNPKAAIDTKDVYKELAASHSKMVAILQDPVLMDLKTDMVSLPCVHIISKASAIMLQKKECPQCRTPFAVSALKTNKAVNETVEELITMQKILGLCDPSTHLPSNANPKDEQPLVTINVPISTSPSPLAVPSWDPGKIDKLKSPHELFSKVMPVLRNLYQNADLIFHNHGIFKKILTWTENIPIYKNACYFSTYVFKHAYFVCLQKKQLQIVEDADFGKNVTVSNAVFPDYYSPILFRAFCEWTLQEIVDLSTINKLDSNCLDRIKSTLAVFDSQQTTNPEIKPFHDAIKFALSPMYLNQSLTPSENFNAFLRNSDLQCSVKLGILGKLKTECLKNWEKRQ